MNDRFAARRARIRLAARLAWEAFRGRTVDVRMGNNEGEYHVIGVLVER